MGSLIAIVSELFTAILGWIGDILAVIVAEPLLLVGFIFTIIFSSIGVLRAVRQ